MSHQRIIPTQVTKATVRRDVCVVIGTLKFLFRAYTISGGIRPRKILKPINHAVPIFFRLNKPLAREQPGIRIEIAITTKPKTMSCVFIVSISKAFFYKRLNIIGGVFKIRELTNLGFVRSVPSVFEA